LPLEATFSHSRRCETGPFALLQLSARATYNSLPH
jgi:hypothetical protein